MSETRTPGTTETITKTQIGIFRITIGRRDTWPASGEPWYVVACSDALGISAEWEALDTEADARSFGNACWRIAKDSTQRDGGLNPHEIIDMAVAETDAMPEDEYRGCECEIDWKCGVCREIGRRHSRLDGPAFISAASDEEGW